MKYLEIAFYLGLSFYLMFHSFANCFYFIPFQELIWFKTLNQSFIIEERPKNIEYPKFNKNFYQYKNKIFYYDRTGDIQHKLTIGTGQLITASPKNYIVYNKIGEQISMFQKSGYPLWKMSSYSYPFLSTTGNRFVLLSTDNTSISLYDLDRNSILTNQFIGSMILDFEFCAFNDNLILGNSEGKVFVFDYESKKMFEKKILESKHNYIKSVSASKKGTYYGCISGMYPEWIYLWDENGKELWRRKTEFNRKNKTSFFIDEQNQLFIEQGINSILVRSLKNGKLKFEINLSDLPFSKILYTQFDSAKDKVLLLLKTDGASHIIVFSTQGEILWKSKHVDEYFLHGEFDDGGEYFLVQTSDNLFCFRLNHL